MKLSVSLPDEDVAFLDEYASEIDADSRDLMAKVGAALRVQLSLD